MGSLGIAVLIQSRPCCAAAGRVSGLARIDGAVVISQLLACESIERLEAELLAVTIRHAVMHNITFADLLSEEYTLVDVEIEDLVD